MYTGEVYGNYMKTSVKNKFCPYINKYREREKLKSTFVEVYWNFLKERLLEATNRSFGWTKNSS